MSDIATHGWTAVPVDHTKILNDEDAKKNPPKAIPKEELLAPANDLIKTITQYAQANLPKETFNHSLRVYAFCMRSLLLESSFTHNSHCTATLTQHSPRTNGLSPLHLPHNLPRNNPLNLPPPRYRLHYKEHAQHAPLLRIPRRPNRTQPPLHNHHIPTTTIRSRHRSNNPAPGRWHRGKHPRAGCAHADCYYLG